MNKNHQCDEDCRNLVYAFLRISSTQNMLQAPSAGAHLIGVKLVTFSFMLLRWSFMLVCSAAVLALGSHQKKRLEQLVFSYHRSPALSVDEPFCPCRQVPDSAHGSFLCGSTSCLWLATQAMPHSYDQLSDRYDCKRRQF